VSTVELSADVGLVWRDELVCGVAANRQAT
jgi:hypothetical protein